MGTVAGLWRYPVKSAGGQGMTHVDANQGGVVGDRKWAVVDDAGIIVSAKHPARGGRLLQVSCGYCDGSGETRLRVPAGPEVVAGTAEADRAVSAWLSEPVHLSSDPVPGAALRRWWPSQLDLVPEWQSSALPGTAAVTSMAGPARHRSFVDYGALHLIFTDDLRRLGVASCCDIDPIRFRPNILVEGGSEFRDASRIRIGDVILDVELPTPRCALPGVSPQNGTLDAAILRALAKHDRRPVGSLGTAACFGLYARLSANARFSVGDQVSAE